MARQDFPPREIKKQNVKGEHPEPGFEQEAAPEATNYDHPQAIGTRAAVPGAGVVSSGADAGPVETNPDVNVPRAYPGQGAGPLSAPDALRPGTTRSAPASAPSGAGEPGGSSSHSEATEAITEGGGAPLSVPSDSVGPQPSAPDVPELYDPNYTAASQARGHRGRADHRNVGPDASVRDAMSSEVTYCTPETSIEYVARKMADSDVGAIPVIDNVDRMVPIGIVTDRDIVVRVVAKGQDASALRADQCMSMDVFTVREDAPLNEAVLLMERHKVRRVPVVDSSGRLVGMLAQADIADAAPHEETADLLREISRAPGNE